MGHTCTKKPVVCNGFLFRKKDKFDTLECNESECKKKECCEVLKNIEIAGIVLFVGTIVIGLIILYVNAHCHKCCGSKKKRYRGTGSKKSKKKYNKKKKFNLNDIVKDKKYIFQMK